jgi:predicted RNase H-like HicB family nuclease
LAGWSRILLLQLSLTSRGRWSSEQKRRRLKDDGRSAGAGGWIKALEIEFEIEEDGRWIAAFNCLPGVLAYGSTQEEARLKAEMLAHEVLEEKPQK